MSYKQSHLDALQEAIATGAMEIEYDGPNGKVHAKYRTFNQMLQLEEKLKRELGQGAAPSSGIGYLGFDRGTGR